MTDLESWGYVAMIGEGEAFVLGPVDNIWAHKWTRVPGLRVRVHHPHYPDQSYDVGVDEIAISGEVVRFACVELSNGVYGVFVADKNTA